MSFFSVEEAAVGAGCFAPPSEELSPGSTVSTASNSSNHTPGDELLQLPEPVVSAAAGEEGSAEEKPYVFSDLSTGGAASVSSTAEPTSAVPRFAPGLRVLVADDMALNRKLMLRVFAKEIGGSWRTSEADTAEKVLTALSEEQFDLLIIDEYFSDDGNALRGSGAIARFREQEAQRGGRLPIISCTCNAQQEGARIMACGADDVWGKPFPKCRDGSLQRCLARVMPQHVVES